MPKTFHEIENKLKADLVKISQEILDIERSIQAGEEMLEKELEKQKAAKASGKEYNEDVIFIYRNELSQLRGGHKMFHDVKRNIEQTLEKLCHTVEEADRYIKRHE